jgi:Protein of unknown function (Hypoth_ymh)
MSKKQIPFPNFHSLVDEVSKSLYESGHYTDALRKASIKLEEECAKKLFQINGQELTGEPLMMELFVPKNGKAHIEFVNLSKKGGDSKQKSFGFMYSGFAGVIRNTLAHSSDNLEDIEALYGLNMVSYLFYKLDQVQKSQLLVPDKEEIKILFDITFEDKIYELIEQHENVLSNLFRNKTKPEIAETMFYKYVENILLNKIDVLPDGLFDYYSTNKEFQNQIYTNQVNKYYAQ